jgi:hypothetical protein
MLDRGIHYGNSFSFPRETLDYPVKPDNDRHIEIYPVKVTL